MPTLKAVFKIFDGYSGPMAKVIQKSDEATNKILKTSGAADNLNNKLNQIGVSANRAGLGLGKFLGITALIAGAVKGMNIADEYTNTSARLALINDGLQTQAELQNKIFAAANRSKGAYTDMAGAISKMGLLAGDSFKSNDELIAFSELVQKSFKVGGASGSEQSAGLQQLTQAMAAGKLQGDEFRSIMENAPMIATAIAKFTGKSKGELKEMSAEGTITADIIKNAMFAMSDDINEKFETMPMTFADVWNRIKNGALQAFAPVIESVNKLINSAAFSALIDGIIVGINLLSMAINGLINLIVDNWPLIQSILMAIGIYLAVTVLPGFIAAGIAGLQSGLMIAAGWIAANAPMIMIIATLALIIYALMQAGVTAEDVFGFIGAVVGIAVALIYNLFLGLVEFIIGAIETLINPFVVFAEFIGNLFVDPISAVIYLFQGLADTVLALLEKIASALDFVFGSKMADTVSEWRKGLKQMADEAVMERGYNPKDFNKAILDLGLDDFGLDRMEYGKAAETGQSIGKNVYGDISNKLNGLTNSFTGKNENGIDMSQFGTQANPITVKGPGKNDSVKVDMGDEDLKYLRDIAERDYINKFSTATLAPNVSISFGDVHQEADADKVAGRIKKILQEEIAMSAEGAC